MLGQFGQNAIDIDPFGVEIAFVTVAVNLDVETPFGVPTQLIGQLTAS